MIVLLIFGGLMLVLALCYLAYSIQQSREWKGATVLVILSMVATAYGGWGLNQKHHAHNHRTPTTHLASTRQKNRINNSVVPTEFKLNQPTLAGTNQPKPTQWQQEIAVFRQMQKNYSKFGLVTFNAKTRSYNITPTDGQTVKAFNALANKPKLANRLGWHKLTESVKQNSQQLSRDKILGKGYQIQLMNPANQKTLYTAKDGQTTFDIAHK